MLLLQLTDRHARVHTHVSDTVDVAMETLALWMCDTADPADPEPTAAWGETFRYLCSVRRRQEKEIKTGSMLRGQI